MLRTGLLVFVLAGAAAAHGGVFRPPPDPPPRDPSNPGGGLTPTTPGSEARAAIGHWGRWWRFNRDRWLRLRERTVRTPVDRAALRKQLLPALAVALEDESPVVRAVAAIGIGRLHAREHGDQLLERFKKDGSRHVREAAALAIALLGDPVRVPWMKVLLAEDKHEARVRGFMLIGLARMGRRHFLEQVLLGVEKLRGSPSDVEDLRACGAFALGHMRDPHACMTLARVATDKSESRHVRGFAAAALAWSRSPLAAPEVLRLMRDRDGLHEARYGAAIAVGGVVRATEDGTLDLLGEVAQRDKNGGVRALLFMSLGRIGGARAAEQIREEATKTKEQTMRGFAYLALGMSKAPDAGETLMKEFKRRKNPEERAACALGMALCGHRDGIALIRDEFERNNPAYVRYASLALGLLGDAEAKMHLRLLVENERRPSVLRAAASGLALLEGPAAVTPILARFHAVKSSSARGALAQVLGEIATAQAFGAVLAFAKDGKNRHFDRAQAFAAAARIAERDAISPFSRYAIDVNTYVTCSTVEVLVSLF